MDMCEKEGAVMEKLFLREFKHLTYRDLPVVLHGYCALHHTPLLLLNRALSAICEPQNFTLPESRKILETYAYHKHANLHPILRTFAKALPLKTGRPDDWIHILNIYFEAKYSDQKHLQNILKTALQSQDSSPEQLSYLLKRCVDVAYTPPEGHWIWAKTPSPLLCNKRWVSVENLDTLVKMKKYTFAMMIFSRIYRQIGAVTFLEVVTKFPHEILTSGEMKLMVVNILKHLDITELSPRDVLQAARLHYKIGKRVGMGLLNRLTEELKKGRIPREAYADVAMVLHNEPVFFDKEWDGEQLTSLLETLVGRVKQLRVVIEAPERFKYREHCSGKGVVVISWGLMASGEVRKAEELLMECEAEVEEICEVELPYLVGLYKLTTSKVPLDFLFDCIDMSLARSGLVYCTFDTLTSVLAHSLAHKLPLLDHFLHLLAEHIASLENLTLTPIQITWFLWSTASIPAARPLFRVFLSHPKTKMLLAQGGKFPCQVDQACAKAGFTMI
eukprot:TRINITY_DN22804_c0_g1_i1.p1 TRINITY_DN22804_c0_g1~~TRINITY_DN22804_c0_g1_i1.p1  ORF type:complete len:535 (+),score=186.76 TRINITY_DN22804_c0_g1_i1:101-1606(+)